MDATMNRLTAIALLLAAALVSGCSGPLVTRAGIGYSGDHGVSGCYSIPFLRKGPVEATSGLYVVLEEPEESRGHVSLQTAWSHWDADVPGWRDFAVGYGWGIDLRWPGVWQLYVVNTKW
jgi:hypothetical protein